MLIAIAAKPRGVSPTLESRYPIINGAASAESRSAEAAGSGMKSIDKLVLGSGVTVAFADEIMVVSRVDATASSSGAPLNVPTEQVSSLFGFSSTSLGFVMAAGVELGVYLFIEVATESVGLQLTSATRAGFLTQSTAVLTPVLAYLAVRLKCIHFLCMGSEMVLINGIC